jgi:hypothetical protein
MAWFSPSHNLNFEETSFENSGRAAACENQTKTEL